MGFVNKFLDATSTILLFLFGNILAGNRQLIFKAIAQCIGDFLHLESSAIIFKNHTKN